MNSLNMIAQSTIWSNKTHLHMFLPVETVLHIPGFNMQVKKELLGTICFMILLARAWI